MERLKYGSFKTMTKEEQRQHKRELDRNWRHSHPEWVKEQNEFYYELRKKNKPFVCTCKYCGSEFNANQKDRKICPECRNRPPRAEVLRKELSARRVARINKYKEMEKLYKSGLTISRIARKYGTSYSYIRYCLDRYEDMKNTI